jgi:hypothetical protein
MSWLLELRLIRLFDLYLTVILILSTVLRLRRYHAILVLVRAFSGRWPRLFQLVKQHRNIFLTWGTVFPLVVTLGLWTVQMLASRLLWPHADLTVGRLFAVWPALPVVVVCGAAMVSLDLYGSWNVGALDRVEMEKYFDQAEYWLKSWAAPVVRVFTLGFINPRRMVAVEVRAALVNASRLLNSTLWWVSIQAGLRIAYGLSLWGTYALEPWLRGWLGLPPLGT